MHTYIKSKDEQLWTVGHYKVAGAFAEWVAMRDFSTESEASGYVNFLNGGDGKFPNF
jgi:hypothetical protein